MLIINQMQLGEIIKEAEACYPYEACGFILGVVENENRVAQKIIVVENKQNQFHQKDPNRYPRDAKTAYAIDPKDMEKIQKEATLNNQKIISIFHSHPEHGVYFSDEDKSMAAPWGEPLFPELSYVVVSVYNAKAKNASDFYWDENQKNFLERKLR